MPRVVSVSMRGVSLVRYLYSAIHCHYDGRTRGRYSNCISNIRPATLKQRYLSGEEGIQRSIARAYDDRSGSFVELAELADAAFLDASAFNLDSYHVISAFEHEIDFEIALTPPIELKVLQLGARDERGADGRFDKVTAESRIVQEVSAPSPRGGHE